MQWTETTCSSQHAELCVEPKICGCGRANSFGQTNACQRNDCADVREWHHSVIFCVVSSRTRKMNLNFCLFQVRFSSPTLELIQALIIKPVSNRLRLLWTDLPMHDITQQMRVISPVPPHHVAPADPQHSLTSILTSHDEPVQSARYAPPVASHMTASFVPFPTAPIRLPSANR